MVKTYVALAVFPAASDPANGSAGGPVSWARGEPSEPVTLTVTKLRSMDLADPLVMAIVSSTPGPETSPGPTAVASMGLADVTRAVTLPPKAALDVSGTGGLVVTARDLTVWWIFPAPDGGGTGVVRSECVVAVVESDTPLASLPADDAVVSGAAPEVFDPVLLDADPASGCVERAVVLELETVVFPLDDAALEPAGVDVQAVRVSAASATPTAHRRAERSPARAVRRSKIVLMLPAAPWT